MLITSRETGRPRLSFSTLQRQLGTVEWDGKHWPIRPQPPDRPPQERIFVQMQTALPPKG